MKYVSVFALIILLGTSVNAQKKVSIGVITDLNKERYLEIKNSLVQEISKTIGVSYQLSMDATNEIYCGDDPLLAKDGYLKLTPNTDIVLLIGSMSIHGVLQIESLDKPTIGIGVFNNSLQGIPITSKGTSGIPNFTYVKSSVDLLGSIRNFQSLHDFNKPAVLVDAGFSELFASNVTSKGVSNRLDSLNLEIETVLIDQDIDKSVLAIDPAVDAVVIALPYQLSDSALSRLIASINERGIPTYSITQGHVHKGALFSQGNENDFQQMIRKLSIMVDDIVHGSEPEEMDVLLNVPQDLYMNISTAKAIKFETTFETILTTNIVNTEDETKLLTYSLESVIEKALEENLSIKISYADLKYSEFEVKQAKSSLLPGVDINNSFSIIDEPSAFAGRSEQSLTLTPGVTQVIYSENVIANIKIQKYLLEAQNYATKQEIIDVVLDCYLAYINVLKAKRQLYVQQQNLKTNRANLDLARIRTTNGASDSSDIFRFEGEVASSKQMIIESQVSYRVSKLQLNNLLNNTLEDNFEIDEIDSESDLLKRFEQSVLAKSVEGPLQLEEITKFLVSESKANYPSSLELAANLKVLERQKKMNNRQFFLPSFSANGQFNYYPYRGGAGSEPQPGMEVLDQTWNVGLTMSYTIFNGGQRRLDLQQTRVQQLQLEDQISSLHNNLEFSVKSNVFDLLKSSTDLKLSKISSENQQKNFNLIQKKYQNGLISITQLLDAQSSYLNAQFNYYTSIYDYLFAFLQLENSLGFHSQLTSEEEKLDFENRFQNFLNEQNE